MGAPVGSHQYGQIRILFPFPTWELKPFSKTNLAANILFHAKKTNLIPNKPRISLYGLDFRPKVFIFLEIVGSGLFHYIGSA